MAEFNSYLLGKVTKSVGNITLVYTKISRKRKCLNGKTILRRKFWSNGQK